MLGMSHEGHKDDLKSVFWRHFDEAWEESGLRSAEHASTQLRTRTQLKYQLAPATIRDWCKHRRLPRNEDDFRALCCLLVGEERARGLVDELQAAKRGKAAEEKGGQTNLWAGVCRWMSSHYAVVGAGIGVLVVAGVILWLVVPSGEDGEEAPTANPTPPTQSSRTTATSVQVAECPSQTVRAESQKQRASATYCRERREFLLSDDDGDNMSAILVIRVNGDERPAWFHSEGYRTRTPDGEFVRVPPRPIPVSLKAGNIADFRVCYGDKNEDLTYSEDTCGDWTPFWPAR